MFRVWPVAELPNPPDNPDFEMLSERKQNEINARFQRGIELCYQRLIDGRRLRQARDRARDYARAHGPFRTGGGSGFATLGDVARLR